MKKGEECGEIVWVGGVKDHDSNLSLNCNPSNASLICRQTSLKYFTILPLANRKLIYGGLTVTNEGLGHWTFLRDTVTAVVYAAVTTCIRHVRSVNLDQSNVKEILNVNRLKIVTFLPSFQSALIFV